MTKKVLLKGISASAGLVMGRVRIVQDHSQILKMRKGEILVTEMTSPRFTPAISKAKALVTDIGGLLCHAAIVAREMGIPCVVATKKATQLLKDGQKVIVNAVEGKIYEAK